MKQKTFKGLELEGWEHHATMYDTFLAPVTEQAIEPMLASFGDLSDKSFLDIACGTGHLAGRASRQQELTLPKRWCHRLRVTIQKSPSLEVTLRS